MRLTIFIKILIGILVLSVASQITTPMAPVPMTLQSLAVLAISSLYGLRLGLSTIAAWLLIAALGAPVLADASGGLEKFYGPTAGYIAGFIIAGALVGAMAAADQKNANVVWVFLVMCLGHLIILGVGVTWLQSRTGWETALASGFYPFLLGATVKSALGACLVTVFRSMQRVDIGKRETL